MNERTGTQQLNVKHLLSKLGSLAMSSKGCATGTCKNYANPEITAPTINLRSDMINPMSMMSEFGALA